MRTTDSCGDKIIIELEQVGQLDGSFESTGRVYSVEGLSPTLNTMGGGNREPKVLIPQATKQGNIECELGGVVDLAYPNSTTRRGRVQDEGKICPTITAESNGLCRIEPCIAAMRGRNPKNPTSRKSGEPTQQMLEVKDDGTSNTLTTVQKDNLVIEPQVLTPKRTEHGKAVRKAYENGEHQESRHSMTELEPRDDGVTNTLTTVQKDNLVLEPHFRIRKLTPRECWRLMGFTDEDFDKAKKSLNETFYKGNDRSNSQLYKQAGNSIVVDVLENIFKQMEGI